MGQMKASRVLKAQGATQSRRRSSGSFTEHGLSRKELLLILLILTVVAMVGKKTFAPRLDDARRIKTEQDLNRINLALQRYKLDNQHYPFPESGLNALLSPSDIDRNSWNGPYLNREKRLFDPWGRAYQYTLASNGLMVEVFSFGADGQEGGSGANADIFLKIHTP